MIQIGNITIEKIFDKNLKLDYLCYKDLEDPGYEYREYADGLKIWYRNNIVHREDGPAIIYPFGSKYWIINGKQHREDGPAVINSDGRKEWWINGTLILDK